jgi:hypothetical protein
MESAVPTKIGDYLSFRLMFRRYQSIISKSITSIYYFLTYRFEISQPQDG